MQLLSPQRTPRARRTAVDLTKVPIDAARSDPFSRDPICSYGRPWRVARTKSLGVQLLDRLADRYRGLGSAVGGKMLFKRM
jgi:hypothetical protein